jgi:hypothetical protein
MPPTVTPKSLLLSALDEVGEEPLFQLDPVKQQRAIEAASLYAILERGFNVFDVPVRSERRESLFAAASVAAEALDACAVRAAVIEIAAVCRADADAWFAAHGDEAVA